MSVNWSSWSCASAPQTLGVTCAVESLPLLGDGESCSSVSEGSFRASLNYSLLYREHNLYVLPELNDDQESIFSGKIV